MSLLQGGLFENYVSDVAVTMVVGLGYYLFNSLKKKKVSWKDQNKEIKNLKSQLETALERYQYAKTIDEYNELIKSDYERCEDPFAILNEMVKKAIVPNIETYNALLLNCLQTGNVASAKMLKEEILDVTGPVAPNSFTLNILIKGLQVNFNKRVEALSEKTERKIKNVQEKFDEELRETIAKLDERGIHIDIICVNTIIDCLIEQGRIEKSWEIFNHYKKIVRPDTYTYTTLLKGIRQMTLDAEWLNRAFILLEEAKIGYKLEENFFNSILDSCLKFNKTDKAVELFNEMKEKSKNNLSEYAYSMMIKVYGKSFKLEKCMEMFKAIKAKGVPSTVTYVCLINVCIRCRKVDVAEKLLEEMGHNCEAEIYENVYFNLINGYKNNKNFDKANRIFEKYLKISSEIVPSTNIFNAILDCCAAFHKYEKFSEIHKLMEEKRVKFDEITYNILLKCYANSNNVEKTRLIYSLCKTQNFEIDEIIYNTILDLFVRTNEENGVNEIYQDMKNKGFAIGASTYNVLMKQFFNMNNSRKAFELYEDMLAKDITVCEQTFHLVLELQIKTRNAERALAVFKKMLTNKHTPQTVVVDSLVGLCREVNRETEALEVVMFLMNEKIKVDNVVTDRAVDAVISSNRLSLNDKIDVLSKFSLLLKELSLLICCSTYDRLSKFLFQNKTLNKLSSFSESSIYSTNPVANTVTPNYAAHMKQTDTGCGSLYEVNNSDGQYENYAISRNPFIKKQGNNSYRGSGNSGNGNYHSNSYNNNHNYHRSGNNYNSHNGYISGSGSSLYAAPQTKSLYSSNGKDELFGGNSVFKRGNFQK